MNEIVLKGKKNGMAALLIQLVLYVAAFVGLVIGGTKMDAGEMGIYPVLFLSFLSITAKIIYQIDTDASDKSNA